MECLKKVDYIVFSKLPLALHETRVWFRKVLTIGKKYKLIENPYKKQTSNYRNIDIYDLVIEDDTGEVGPFECSYKIIGSNKYRKIFVSLEECKTEHREEQLELLNIK